MASIIQKRRDTAANFTAAEPILAQGEEAYELDTGKEKRGDGVTAWNALAYKNNGSASTTEQFTATAAQTAFVLSTTPVNVDVYVDRMYQILNTDYTITTNTVTLTDGAFLNSIITIRKY